jgi:periplasmic divalent cation tolerance protein
MAEISFSFKYVAIYITAPNREVAEHIGREVLNRRLAACANIVEKVSSLYWWKGKLERDDEVLLFLKSKRTKVGDIIKLVKEIHSYENPAIVVFPIIGGSDKYLKWIEEEVR